MVDQVENLIRNGVLTLTKISLNPGGKIEKNEKLIGIELGEADKRMEQKNEAFGACSGTL
jgi:hypothetical protein